jgi:hypothetical protein
MENHKLRFIYHLDSIRIKKNYTITQLCDGICSDRQYRKYYTGDNNISDARIMEFCDQLGISARDFYYSLNEKDVSELDKIKKVYTAIGNRKYPEAEQLLKQLHHSYMTVQNERFYKYCELRLNYEMTNKQNKAFTLKELSKYMNYPACESYAVFDFVDILFLLLIAQIEIETGNTRSLNILIKILSNNQLLYLSAENRNILPPIYSTVAIMLGKLSMFTECIELADQGINYCTKYAYSISLTRLYYSKAIAYQMLNDLVNAEYYAALCLCNVIAINNKNEINYFYDMLKDDFKKDPFLMIQAVKD